MCSVPLDDNRLGKLEVPILKGKEDEDSNGWLHLVEHFVEDRSSDWDKLPAKSLTR